MDKRWLEVLACPVCKGKLVYDPKRRALICRFDRLAFPIQDGIPVMIAEEAQPVPVDEVGE